MVVLVICCNGWHKCEIVNPCACFWGSGGLKLWEGSLDLIKALHIEVKNGNLSLRGKRVLEVGSWFSGDSILLKNAYSC